MKAFYITLFLISFGLGNLYSQSHHMIHVHETDEIESHKTHLITTGPIGVMNDHMHHQGTFMLSYRFMHMDMAGMYSNSSSVDDSEVFSDFMISPQQMQMQMQMLGGMYAVTDGVTIMAMANFLKNDMSLRMRSEMEFETRSGGMGDMRISVLAKLFTGQNFASLFTLGTGIPTGNLDERDQTPMSENALLAYPMQLGSGTWDPFFGLTYTGNNDLIIWGAQGQYTHRLSKNEKDYSLGNQLFLTSWIGYKVSENLNFTARASFEDQGRISGAHPQMNPVMMPLFDATNSGYSRLHLFGGANWYFNQGGLKGTRIGIEGGHAVIQNVNGLQMKQGFQWTAGVQFIFGKSH